MSAVKHTAVRLEVVGNLVRTGLEHGGFLVADCRDSEGQPHNDEAKANALLFATASELLKSLQECVLLFDLHDDCDDLDATYAARQAARAAITKATGEAA